MLFFFHAHIIFSKTPTKYGSKLTSNNGELFAWIKKFLSLKSSKYKWILVNICILGYFYNTQNWNEFMHNWSFIPNLGTILGTCGEDYSTHCLRILFYICFIWVFVILFHLTMYLLGDLRSYLSGDLRSYLSSCLCLSWWGGISRYSPTIARCLRSTSEIMELVGCQDEGPWELVMIQV